MNQPNPAIEILPQHLKLYKRNNTRELGGVGIAALRVKGVVLGEVEGDVGVEGFGSVFFGVENFDEVEEDGFLVGGGSVAGGAVGFWGARGEEGGGGLAEGVGGD